MDTSISDGTALIYHRHPDDGGDVVSDYLRCALVALGNAGMVEPVSFDGADAFHTRSCVRYRATETTPSTESR